MSAALRRLASAIALTVLSAGACGASEVPSVTTDTVIVTTFAGSGTAGSTDGDAARATFEIPDGLAVGNNGTIYVADAAAQRIRAISGGFVTTIAGSGALGVLGFGVAGGYRDGPALAARFSRPRGLATSPDGAIFVADSGNAAIREIRNGVVTTVLGVPNAAPATDDTPLSQAPSAAELVAASPEPLAPVAPHGVDGPASVARLVRPMSLAIDSAGRLWIADYGGGLRCWDHGTLTTISLAPAATQALSVSVQPDDGTVLLVTRTFVYQYQPKTGKQGFSFNTSTTSEYNAPFGTPSQIAGIGSGRALFTDDVSSGVRFLRFAQPPFTNSPYSSLIAGTSSERHSDNAGFADGSFGNARFSMPSGLLVSDGRAIVADSGNRRLRSFALPAFRIPETGQSSQYRYDTEHYEVALVGASWEFYDSHDGDSMCAFVERQLDASGKLDRPARCHTVRIDAGKIPPAEDYIAANLAFRHVDQIVLTVDPVAGLRFDVNAPIDRASQEFHASLASLLGEIAPSKARFTIFWQYFEQSISNREELRDEDLTPERQLFYDPDSYAVKWRPQEAKLFSLLGDLGLGQCDEYDRVVAYERGSGAPLFMADNGHPSARGNALFGTILGDCLATQLAAKK